MCGEGPEHFTFWGERLGKSQGWFPKKGAEDKCITIKRCSGCGLIFSDPMPLPSKASDLYDLAPEQYWEDRQLTAQPGYFEGEMITLRRFLGPLKDKTVLDIGSGLGFAMQVMEKAGMKVYGVEPSPSFRAACLKEHPAWKDSISTATATEYEFPGKKFNFINFGAVLEHLPDPGQAILHAFAHLNPGGVIHIEVPHADWLVSRLVRLQFRLRGTRWVMNLSPTHRPFHLFEFSKLSFRKHAEKHQYSIREMWVFNTNSYLPVLADMLIRPVMELSRTGIGLKVWLGTKV